MTKLHLSALALVVAAILSGCAGQTGGTGGPSSHQGTQVTPVGIPAGSPQVFDWTGHVTASEAEEPTTHFRPTEDLLWPASQSGFLFSVDEIPQAMEVALEWKGSGQFMIMLHSHKEHGTNVYVEHVTEMDGVNPKCLRVPTADLAHGTWQVMVHSASARETDFTLRIGLLGGAGHVIEDERHGHWIQDGLFEEDRHDIEPCQMLQATTMDATVPTSLPPETHFEFGESLGCQPSTSAGPSCIEFKTGPGGTDMDIDGHWIQLGRPYWGLLLNSTIDQGPVANDSDCVFTDEGGLIIGTEDADPDPCADQVPAGAQWVFVYPSVLGALGITVDFALPPAA